MNFLGQGCLHREEASTPQQSLSVRRYLILISFCKIQLWDLFRTVPVFAQPSEISGLGRVRTVEASSFHATTTSSEGNLYIKYTVKNSLEKGD